MRKSKLIWDFRGPDALKVATHHVIHLDEFVKIENLDNIITGHEALNAVHAIAYLVVNEDQMKPIRNALRPHRGQVFSET